MLRKVKTRYVLLVSIFLASIIIYSQIYINYQKKQALLRHYGLINQSHSPITLSAALPESKLITLDLPYNCDNQFRGSIIYLPKGYDATSVEKYPSLFLLHGDDGDETDWIRKGHIKETLDELISTKKIEPLIAVFPDASCGGSEPSKDTNVQYVDTPDRIELNETYLSNYLPDYIDNHYHTHKGARYRAIGGLSAGGFGALNIGLKHQHAFGQVLSFSGYGTIDDGYKIENLIKASHSFADDNSPNYYIKKLQSTEISFWMTVGKDDSLYDENQKLRQLLNKQGFKATYTTPPGGHGWVVWSAQLPDALQWLDKEWRATK